MICYFLNDNYGSARLPFYGSDGSHKVGMFPLFFVNGGTVEFGYSTVSGEIDLTGSGLV